MRPALLIPCVVAAALLATPAGAPVLPFVVDKGGPVSLLSRHMASESDILVALGELAFKSVEIFRTSPTRSGGLSLTCDSCHPDGGASQVLFFEGLSDKPGNIDVTSRAITLKEDGINNPINVPSLRGVRDSAPYGRDGRFEALRDFTRFALVEEFGGILSSALLMDALVAYQESLDYLDNPLLDEAGRLREAAPAAALRGEALFRKPFGSDPARSCATCHVPETGFIDRQSHDVGGGKAHDTPTLRDLAMTAPYFRDGRYDTLDQVVAHFDRRFALGLDAAETADLVAYLEAVGGGAEPYTALDETIHVVTIAELLERTLGARDWLLTKIVILQALYELDARKGAEGAPPAERLEGWIKKLRWIDGLTNASDFAGALAATAEFRATISTVREGPGSP